MMNFNSAMEKGRVTVLMRQPFWGMLALYLVLVESKEYSTAATDGKRMFANPEFVAGLTERELEGLWAHEVAHCAYRHHVRRKGREHKLWNVACDYEVNRDLIRARFTLPKGALLDPRFDHMSAEEIYAVLEREPQDEQQPSDPGGCGEVLDAVPEYDEAGREAEAAKWEVRVRQAIAVEKGRNEGQVPEQLKRMFEAVTTSTVNWRDVVRRFIDSKNRVDFSWSKPNKRYLAQGFIIPGVVPDGVNCVALLVDTSGSMDEKALGRVGREVQAALDEGAVQEVVVVYCDTRVQGFARYQQGDVIKFDPLGGGGTKFSPAFEWVARNEMDVSAIIYFTDLGCSDFGEEPVVPVLWAAYGNAEGLRQKKLPFGELIILTD